jgi:type VI secretion system protein ImpK
VRSARPQAAPAAPRRLVLAGGAAALILLGLVILLIWPAGDGETATGRATAQASPAAADPAAADAGQLGRLRSGLAAEIRAGAVTVDRYGGWVAIRVAEAASFAPGQAALLDGFADLGRRIAALAEREGGPVRVGGHGDDRPLPKGSAFPDADSLSRARAEAVAGLLGAHLADASRLSVQGYGAAEPIAVNAGPEGRARNRRVEILLRRTE